ncbi:non-ribosomal peptide synthetase [Chitinivorax sp. B]|uniref:non-ribosomal peptide synthetase n=1 Tax=Chitinivorax sp. B TaxID=2502235 RepID=UPI001BB22057|nr:non-ribosomal peptide synthetase [Chitinivorax sp. B]
MKLVAQLRRRADLELPVATVFEAQTLSQLASVLERTPTTSTAVVPMQSRPADQAAPLSFAQQRLWVLDQMEGGSLHYHMATALQIDGVLDTARLENALRQVIERHHVLRSTYHQDGDQVWQQVTPDDDLSFHVVPVQDDRPQAEVDWMSHAEAAMAQPFDLTKDLPIRATLIQLAPSRHVLVLILHHIAADGWSASILVDEWRQAYAALSEEQSPDLPVLPLQYADYAYWQRQPAQTARFEQQLTYWQQQLAGLPEVHNLPLDYPRPSVQRFVGRTHTCRIEAQTTAALRSLCQRQGATLFMGLHATLSALLARYSGETDIVIGTPIANREQVEVSGLIGFFVNTLVLRARFDEQPTFLDLLAQIRETTLAAYANQQLPFDRLVEALKPQRSLHYSPLFQVMLSLQNNEEASPSLPGLSVTPVEVPNQHVQFDLTLDVEETTDALILNWEYRSDLFAHETIARMAESCTCLLKSALADPMRPVAHLGLLDEAERQRLLAAGQGASLPVVEQGLHRNFEAQVEADPARLAVIDGVQQLTYAELNQRANRVAHRLLALGVQPGDIIGLHLHRSAHIPAGIFGVFKAGAAYVPLEPGLPGERLAYFLADTGARHVLADGPVPAGFEGVSWLRLDQLIHVDELPDTNPGLTHPDASELAYVVYTSGTTGKPKGVQVEHGAMQHRLAGWISQFGFDRHPPRVLQMAGLSVDICLGDLLKSLCTGGSVVMCPRDALVSAPDLYHLLETTSVTFGDFVPAVLRELMDELRAHGRKLTTLRHVLVGSESWYGTDLLNLKSVLSEQARCYNVYGQTESVIDVSCCDLTHQQVAPERVVPMGLPLPNTQLLVLGRDGQMQPTGVAGELYIGGPGLARGYLNRVDQTAERFLSLPGFTGRLYRTGDYARYRHDGTLDFLGRLDAQVKIRGFRIELGEIETTLQRIDGVRQVVVDVFESTPGERRLVAYIVMTEAQWQPEQIRTTLRQQLPDYMVPAALVRMDGLPQTATGKVDRKALPVPDESAMRVRHYEAPAGFKEQTLSAIWAEVLQVQRVGRHDNFFDLGGHSLLAVKLISRMRQKGLVAEVRAVFASTTLAELAANTREEQDDFQVPANLIPDACNTIQPEMLPLVTLTHEEIACIEAVIPGGGANIQDIYPLAPVQEGILFHSMIDDGGMTYVEPTLLKVTSRQRLDAVLMALQQVINRHDILRTAIVTEGLREPVQVVCRQVQLPVVEIAGDAHPVAALQRATTGDVFRIELTQAPLMQSMIVADVAGEGWYLMLLEHHIIGDHMSLEILIDEVHTILDGQAEALPVPVPYRNFVAQLCTATNKEAETRFFQAMLADVTESTAPFGVMDVQVDVSRAASLTRPLSKLLGQQLRQQALRLGVGPAVLCHVAWALVVARTSGRDDVVFGSVLSGRMRGLEAIERIPGAFINTLPLRTRLDGQTVWSVVMAMRDSLTDLLRYEQASLARAQRCSGVPAPAPLFTALLNYRHSAANELTRWDGVEVIEHTEWTNYPFALFVDDMGDAFDLTAQCAHQIEPQRMLGYVETALQSLLEALTTAPDTPVLQLNVLPVPEQELVTQSFNQTVADYPPSLLVHQLFEAQVQRTPDAVALVFEDELLTYRELDERANRLANHLRQLGIGPDQRVAILIERSIEMVVGLFGVLKAGGAYVPLDPSYPADRLAYMLNNAEPAVLLTQSSLQGLVSISSIPCIALDTDWHEIATAPATPLQPIEIGLDARHLAYVIYTSGSTGQPKGVMNEHRGVVNRLQWMQATFQLDAHDRVLQKTPFGFDVSVWEFFWPLLAGAQLVIARPDGHKSPDYLAELIDQRGITTLHFVPSMMQAYLNMNGHQQHASLRQVFCSGEALPPSLRDRFLGCWPQVALHNLYGPTEAAVDVTWYHCISGEYADKVPIGRPIANTRMYLLDPQGQPVPLGVAGEIHIAGIQVARGYLNRAELTAERFITDPFVSDVTARMYRTGDLGRWLPDGNIEYLGRNDFQVKLRGLRIELGEIEAALALHPLVREVVVVARDDRGGDPRLVAYVTLHGDLPESGIDWRAQLAQRLPEYMVPSALIVLPSLPLTANGKLDRKALPAPDFDTMRTEAFMAPEGEVETTLAAIWQPLLGVDRVSRHDDFFALGGHSLLALRLVIAIRQTFSMEFDLNKIFENSSLHQQASAIGDLLAAKALTQQLTAQIEDSSEGFWL